MNHRDDELALPANFPLTGTSCWAPANGLMPCFWKRDTYVVQGGAHVVAVINSITTPPSFCILRLHARAGKLVNEVWPHIKPRLGL
jgi:hypothetical protein